MELNGHRIVIIGGGIAGLCAAVYAQRCGYQTEVIEMHDTPGGLASSWRRSGYTFEGCLHWLVGSKPGGDFNGVWREVCDIDQLRIVDPEEFVQMETEHGESLRIFTNADRLEKELLEHAPRDEKAIHALTHDIRVLSRFRMAEPGRGWRANCLTYLRDACCLPTLRRLANISGSDYGKQFTHPLLRSFFGEGEMGELSAIALVISLGWMNRGNAGYAIGGSQALIRLILKKLAALGGRVRCGARVERILVDQGKAVGVELAGGEKVMADWVISAADGHATIFDWLEGRYANEEIQRMYATMPTFPSYLQVSLGVGMNLAGRAGMVSRILDTPIRIDPETEVKQMGFRLFHFDPTFAPAGKTAVTTTIATRNYKYWTDLHWSNLAAYQVEKQRVAHAAIDVLEGMIPGARAAVEVVDVSTPATVIRYTGNWKGSMEGWFLVPGCGFRPLPNRLPGLERFMMVGQWVMPGGGLPSGPMTARPAIRAICKEDHVPFLPAVKTRDEAAEQWRLRTP
ncbi:MAG: phytoene desaturase family protein [Acidobacteriota bacterium]